MRFASQYKQYGMQIVPQREMVLATGQVQTLQEGLYVKFTTGDLSDDEIRICRESFSMHGFKTERDEVTMVDPLSRLSVFDTDLAAKEFNWTDEEKALVEETLMERSKETTFIVYLPAQVVEAPFPAYDSFDGTTEELLQKLISDGFELSKVRIYEIQSKNRPEVVKALSDELDRQGAADAEREFVVA